MRAPSTYIRGLDGLRGLAILAVILWHTASSAPGFPAGSLGPFGKVVGTGWAGVDLFFALSGFLITRLVLLEEAGAPDGRFDVRRFYWRRILRILPAFFAVLALNVLVLGPLGLRSASVPPLHALWSFATFTSNYYLHYVEEVRAGTAYLVYWSLCVEEHFYLVWPFALVLLKRRRDRILVALAVCVALPLLRWALVARGIETTISVYYLSHYRLDAILSGALAALLYQPLRRAVAVRRALLALSAGTAVLLLALGQLSQLPAPTLLGLSLGFSALAATASLLVVEVSATPDSAAARGLASGPLAALGRVSYGMYLLHFQMMDVAVQLTRAEVDRSLARSLFAFAVCTLITYGAALVMHRLVEQPFLRLKRHAPCNFEPDGVSEGVGEGGA